VSLAGVVEPGVLGVLLYRPAIVSVPLAFGTMIVVSLLTARERPADVDAVMLRLHAPERLGLSRDAITGHDAISGRDRAGFDDPSPGDRSADPA
jgi:hypothetical protein